MTKTKPASKWIKVYRCGHVCLGLGLKKDRVYSPRHLSRVEATALILAGAEKENSLQSCWRCRMREVQPKPEDEERG